MRVGISRKNFHLWNRLLKRKLLQPMVCYRSTEKEKHAYLCRMFNQDRTSGVKPALHKVCCVYASLFPNVPEWEIPRKVFSVLNSSSSTAHWCPVLFFQPFNAFCSTHPCWIGENKTQWNTTLIAWKRPKNRVPRLSNQERWILISL